MLKKVLMNILKAALALGLLWWLANSGKLNWALLSEITARPGRLAFVGCLLFSNLLLCSWRWRLLLSARAKQLMGLGRLYFVNWIGMFFSSALPGSVTGDVVKVLYVKRQDERLSMPFLLFSCLIDRVMGLIGLILLIGCNTLLNFDELMALSPKLAPLLRFNLILLLALSIALTLYFAAPGVITRTLAWPKDRWPGKALFARLRDLWSDFAEARPQMLKCILISVVVQTTGAMVFHILATPLYHTQLSASVVLSIIPLGFIAVAVPIAPGGLGVGHAAFQSLFVLIGEQGGANFFNLYFVVNMVFNLLGFIPWLVMRRK